MLPSSARPFSGKAFISRDSKPPSPGKKGAVGEIDAKGGETQAPGPLQELLCKRMFQQQAWLGKNTGAGHNPLPKRETDDLPCSYLRMSPRALVQKDASTSSMADWHLEALTASGDPSMVCLSRQRSTYTLPALSSLFSGDEHIVVEGFRTSSWRSVASYGLKSSSLATG